jgi:hypothetical protein
VKTECGRFKCASHLLQLIVTVPFGKNNIEWNKISCRLIPHPWSLTICRQFSLSQKHLVLQDRSNCSGNVALKGEKIANDQLWRIHKEAAVAIAKHYSSTWERRRTLAPGPITENCISRMSRPIGPLVLMHHLRITHKMDEYWRVLFVVYPNVRMFKLQNGRQISKSTLNTISRI